MHYLISQLPSKSQISAEVAKVSYCLGGENLFIVNARPGEQKQRIDHFCN
jgi:hypothetical protein